MPIRVARPFPLRLRSTRVSVIALVGMMNDMTCGGWMTLGWVLGIVLLVLAVVAIVWIARRRPSGPSAGHAQSRSDALEQAGVRYARGEIDRETYITIRDDLPPRAPNSA